MSIRAVSFFDHGQTQLIGIFTMYSRTDWPSDAGNHTLDSLMSKAQYSADGYVNVADAVGLSGHRDYSTYHQFWVRRQFSRRRRDYYDQYEEDYDNELEY